MVCAKFAPPPSPEKPVAGLRPMDRSEREGRIPVEMRMRLKRDVLMR